MSSLVQTVPIIFFLGVSILTTRSKAKGVSVSKTKGMADYRYRLIKRFYAFWQKYQLKTELKNILRLFYLFIITWLVGSVITIFSQVFFSPDIHHTLPDYLQYFWIVIIELVSGFDIGDIHLNAFSQVITVIMLIVGIVIVGLFTGQIISLFVHVHQRKDYLPEKPETFHFKRPLLICGISAKVDAIIHHLRSNPQTRDQEIVIIDETADQYLIRDQEIYRDVWCVRGNVADRKVLRTTLGCEESVAIILAQECDPGNISLYSDSKAIQTALAIEAFDENVHTILELIDRRNLAHLMRTRINEFITVSDYGVKLLSQTAMQPGLSNIYDSLIDPMNSDAQSPHIYFYPLPTDSPLIGMKYGDIVNQAHRFFSDSMTLVGMAKWFGPILNTGDVDRNEQILQELRSLGIELRNTKWYVQINPHKKANYCKFGIDFFQQQIEANSEITLFLTHDTVLQEYDKLVYLASNPIKLS